MELNVKALSPKIGTEIPAPFYASAGAAAMDLHACVDQAVTIPAGGRAVIPTGIAIALPSAGYVALVFARSGLGIKRHRPCQLRGRHRQRLPGRDPGGTPELRGRRLRHPAR